MKITPMMERGAWEALLSFYEGEEAKQVMVADANQIIQDTKYQGKKKSFGFETYTQKFLSAFQIKKLYGEEVQGTKQVQDFIKGIEHEKVAAIATPLLGNDKFNSNLQMAAAHITDVARLQGLLQPPKTDPNRHIAMIRSGHGYGQGRGGQGCGHGSNQGCGYG